MAGAGACPVLVSREKRKEVCLVQYGGSGGGCFLGRQGLVVPPHATPHPGPSTHSPSILPPGCAGQTGITPFARESLLSCTDRWKAGLCEGQVGTAPTTAPSTFLRYKCAHGAHPPVPETQSLLRNSPLGTGTQPQCRLALMPCKAGDGSFWVRVCGRVQLSGGRCVGSGQVVGLGGVEQRAPALGQGMGMEERGLLEKHSGLFLIGCKSSPS